MRRAEVRTGKADFDRQPRSERPTVGAILAAGYEGELLLPRVQRGRVRAHAAARARRSVHRKPALPFPLLRRTHVYSEMVGNLLPGRELVRTR